MRIGKFEIKISTIVRLILTAAILVLVWKNAHWSVALSITSMTVSIEILAWAINLIKPVLPILIGMNKKD